MHPVHFHGRVAAEFSVRGGRVSGYIACSTPEGTEAVQEKHESLQHSLQKLFAGQKEGPELGSIDPIYSMRSWRASPPRCN